MTLEVSATQRFSRLCGTRRYPAPPTTALGKVDLTVLVGVQARERRSDLRFLVAEAERIQQDSAFLGLPHSGPLAQVRDVERNRAPVFGPEPPGHGHAN